MRLWRQIEWGSFFNLIQLVSASKPTTKLEKRVFLRFFVHCLHGTRKLTCTNFVCPAQSKKKSHNSKKKFFFDLVLKCWYWCSMRSAVYFLAHRMHPGVIYQLGCDVQNFVWLVKVKNRGARSLCDQVVNIDDLQEIRRYLMSVFAASCILSLI